MSLIGREIEKHIAENKIGKFEQATFAKGGNILDNLFILRECRWMRRTDVQEKKRTDGGNSDRFLKKHMTE